MKKLLNFLRKILPSFFFKKKKRVTYESTNNLRDWTIMERKILFAINKYQKEIGNRQIKADANCWLEAKKRTKYFTLIKKISHDNMEFSFDRLKQKNITYCAEILEANHTTVKSIMKSWKNSVRHNNILQVGIYKYCGVSRIKDGKHHYVCVIFAT